ncbi:hypothetical protein FQN54_004490 [Arachnomyces sp. PD_36]|nr:hypothetical protein FQN54_004490 [Arachnomyces sp. PD_36]
MAPTHSLCYVCGVVIGAKHWDERNWASLPVYDTDLATQQDLDWCSDFRAIVFDEAQHRPPFLSGVGRIIDGLDLPSPPSNRAAHYKDDPPVETVEYFPAHPASTAFELDPVYGYPVHDHCWTFLERRLGCISDAELTPLTNVLSTRWADEDFGGAKSFASMQWGGGGRNSDASVTLVTDPWNIPELEVMISRCLKQDKKRKRSEDGTHEASDPKESRFPRYLSQELKYFILDYLEFSDVRNALTAFGWRVQEGYCRNRFRRDLFFEVQGTSYSQLDWHILWRESESMLKRGSCRGLINRERIFKIVDSIHSEFHEYQKLYAPELIGNILSGCDVAFKSIKLDEARNIAQTIEISATTNQIHFSFTGSDSVDSVLSGIEVPGHSKLGYVNSSLSLISKILEINSPIHCCHVKMGAKGIHDIKLIYKDGNSGWITGFTTTDSSVGILFDNQGEGAFIYGMMDARQLTAIGSISKGRRQGSCDHKSTHSCLRPSELWRPDVPPSTVNLNEDKYTENGPDGPIAIDSRRPIIYQPLRYTIFGGIHGELIESLRGIKGYQAQPSFCGPCGLEFIYFSRDNLLWGSRGEHVSSIEMNKGEYVEKIQIDDRTDRVRPMLLKVMTNRGQTLTVGTRGDSPGKRTSHLTANADEMIVGFYSGPFEFFQSPYPSQTAEDFVGFGIITAK